MPLPTSTSSDQDEPDYLTIFKQIIDELSRITDHGQVAGYIPELSRIDPDKFGVHLTTVDKRHHFLGDSNEKFSIQSIAKVLSLAMAYNLMGESLWSRVSVEPAGTSFNSLVQLEHNLGIPRNPLLNAGAMIICDVLITNLEKPQEEFLKFLRQLSGNPDIEFCPRIAQSERATGYKNAALINLMKSFSNIKNDIHVVLDFYFNLCSIEMTCREVARTFLFLANNGIDPYSSHKILSSSKSKRVNAIMQLCGFYDEAGEFSFKVGLPGKSGVGGGIVAVHPGKYSIAVWSPRLNEKGNSYKGMAFLEKLTTLTHSSIF